jgi:alpha-D-xyloside xylohydrolase
MKFSDGNWMTQPGLEIIAPIQAFDVQNTSDSLKVYATPKDLTHRWAQLDLPLLTVQLSSPVKDVIRVLIYRHKGTRRKAPEFFIFEKGNSDITIEQTNTEASLTSGQLTVKIRKKDAWGIDFYQGDKRITGSGHKSMAHITSAEGTTYMREQLDLGVGEYIYGLGERFTSFIKNGQNVEIWNRDGGTSTEQSYKNIPFYLSNKGYGVFINHPENVSFEVASEKVSKVQFSVEGEYLEYFIIGGSCPKEVLQNYTTLTGKPALPPAWSFGLWLTTSFTTNYDEESVQSFVNGMAERDIPLHVFHFDCFWMKALHWTNFEWDGEVFPDPEGMLTRLKERGLKICVWINPYIAQASHLFDEGLEKGYLLKRPNGDVWQWDKWQPGMALVDFTNPEACEWYADHLRRLVDMGVDSFKTDFGERIPTDVIYHDGSDPEKMHNYYTFLYNKVVFDVLEEKLGRGEVALFARSATAGSQQFPVHWGGDCFANYESMAESLRGGLSLGLSGFGFWSHDIGGFESTAPADLYKRWAAFGLLSSHSRLHGSSSYRVPWLYDEEAVDVVRFFTKLKCRIMPYLFNVACEAATKGTPVMRAMLLEFPNDPTCHYLDCQYMLGASILVAPIFNQEGSVQFYLPKGKWTHFITGERITGGEWREEKHDYLSLPLYVRSNSIIAVGKEENRPDYDFADGVEFHVFELEEGKSTSTVVHNQQGEAELTVKTERQQDVIQVQINRADQLQTNRIEPMQSNKTERSWSILLRGIYETGDIKDAELETTPLGVRITPVRPLEELAIPLKSQQ